MTNTLFPRLRVRSISSIATLLLAAASIACGGDNLSGPSLGANAEGYWFLKLNHRFANLATDAPHNTLQLVATPQKLDGTPYSTALKPTFASTNLAVLQVDSTGAVTAVNSGVAMIVAILKIDNLTHSDTITVGVSKGAAPQVSRISVELSPYWIYPVARQASVMYSITAYNAVGDTVKVEDAAGNMVPLDLITDCAVPDRLIGQCLGVRSGIQYVRANGSGKMNATFSSYVFGVLMSDSIEFKVGNQMFTMISLEYPPITAGTTIAFSPRSVTLATGGVFLFTNGSGEPIDIIFEDSILVKEANPNMSYYYFYPPDGEGNIHSLAVRPDFGWDPKGGRTIYQPGTYKYRNPQTGATGVINVTAE